VNLRDAIEDGTPPNPEAVLLAVEVSRRAKQVQNALGLMITEQRTGQPGGYLIEEKLRHRRDEIGGVVSLVSKFVPPDLRDIMVTLRGGEIEEDAYSLSVLSSLGSPNRQRLRDQLRAALETADRVDEEEGNAVPHDIPLPPGQVRGTNFAEAVKFILDQLDEGDAPKGRE